jgi:GrpB-like predicted nucleotidyltransferase (UPF0157 family)
MESDVIILVSADEEWPARFLEETEAIRAVLGEAGQGFAIEHVGSTAVPGLVAKPIIDMALIPPDGTWPRELLVSKLPILGYLFWAENPDPDHLFFVKGMPPYGKGRSHHLHVRSSVGVAPVLTFRDCLRASDELAREYEALKRRLAATFATDREAYTRGKDSFVARVLAQTRRLAR